MILYPHVTASRKTCVGKNMVTRIMAGVLARVLERVLARFLAISPQ